MTKRTSLNLEYLFHPHAFSIPLQRFAMALEEKTQPVGYKLYTIKSNGTFEIIFWVFVFPFLFVIYYLKNKPHLWQNRMTAVLTLVSFLDMIFFLQSINSSIITWIFSNSSFWSWNLNPISTTNHQLTISKMNTYTIIMFSFLIFSIDSCQLSQDHFFLPVYQK